MRLYRYLTASAGLATIEGKALRVSRLHELNDPFEWRVGLTDVREGVSNIADSAVDSLLAELSEKIGLICFSDTGAESVLWSHYADNHKGIVLEMEVEDDPKKTIEITYTDERPHFSVNRVNEPEYMLPIVDKWIRQKSTGWAYEREYRVYKRLTECDVRNGSYFTPIEEGMLSRVILGWRCPIDVAYVTRAVSTAAYDGVSVVRAKPAATSYKLEC